MFETLETKQNELIVCFYKKCHKFNDVEYDYFIKYKVK